MHWAQDFLRISERPCVDGLNAPLFLAELTTAGERAEARLCLEHQSDIKAKESTPGPLVSENKWVNWKPSFRNYLCTILGMNGTPLSYGIRENDVTDVTGDYSISNEQCVARSPLNSNSYEANISTIHQSIVSFTTSHPSEDWVKTVEKFKDGRESIKALRDHFSGEVNTARRMAEAERMKEQLHYKSERSLTFENVLTKCQKIYNIYETHGEEMSEEAKIRFLFKKIGHGGLSNTIGAMKTKNRAKVVPK